MIINSIVQPDTQLGLLFSQLLSSERRFSRIIFVSAFTALRTILRYRESMIEASETGTNIKLILGIDLGGTSREVLQELLFWNCEINIYHNPISRATFHPKIYLFESENDSNLFLGSNNLTDGGLYTNYEATTQYLFSFPDDISEYQRILQSLQKFLNPTGPCVLPLNAQLIETLSALGILLTEADARRSRRIRNATPTAENTFHTSNPFIPEQIPRPPLLPENLRPRNQQPLVEPQEDIELHDRLGEIPDGVLVWRKILTASDALQVQQGTHHVGGVRLTQAHFENPLGQVIHQTTYFRQLFDDYDWEPEPGSRHRDQEHTFIRMRIIILGEDLGTRNIEISHKPSGEAGQDNYTTILRWGRSLISIIEHANLTGRVFSIFETTDDDVHFLITITNNE
jgi:HKD family nuclease